METFKSDYIICLDNGHGVDTPGKCSPDKKLREYKYAREIVNMLADKLKANGYKVYIVTPEEKDISLKERCKRINKVCRENNNKAISISVHCNAAGCDGKWHSASGWSVFISKMLHRTLRSQQGTYMIRLYSLILRGIEQFRVNITGFRTSLCAGTPFVRQY